MNKFISITFFTNRSPIRLRMVTRDFRSFFYWLSRKQNGFICQLTPLNYWICSAMNKKRVSVHDLATYEGYNPTEVDSYLSEY